VEKIETRGNWNTLVRSNHSIATEDSVSLPKDTSSHPRRPSLLPRKGNSGFPFYCWSTYLYVNNIKLLSVAIEMHHWVLFASLSINLIFCTAFNTICVIIFSCKVFYIFVRFYSNLDFLRYFLIEVTNIKFDKNPSSRGTKTGAHDEADNLFLLNLESTLNMITGWSRKWDYTSVIWGFRLDVDMCSSGILHSVEW
jgi:hypothetical protein